MAVHPRVRLGGTPSPHPHPPNWFLPPQAAGKPQNSEYRTVEFRRKVRPYGARPSIFDIRDSSLCGFSGARPPPPLFGPVTSASEYRLQGLLINSPRRLIGKSGKQEGARFPQQFPDFPLSRFKKEWRGAYKSTLPLAGSPRGPSGPGIREKGLVPRV